MRIREKFWRKSLDGGFAAAQVRLLRRLLVELILREHQIQRDLEVDEVEDASPETDYNYAPFLKN